MIFRKSIQTNESVLSSLVLPTATLTIKHQTKYLITGASGFIGAHLSHVLSKNDQNDVHACIRPSSDTWRIQDICNDINIHFLDLHKAEEVQQILLKINPDIIYNCAFPKHDQKNPKEQERFIQAWIKTFSNLLETCKSISLKAFIHLGSSLIYKESTVPYNENTPIEPISYRGYIKQNERNLCRHYVKKFQIPIVIARIFRAFGPMEPSNRIFMTLFHAAEGGQRIKIAAPDVYRDYIYIDDLIQGLVKIPFSNIQPGEEINFGSGSQHNCQAILAIIESLTGKKVEVSPDYYPPVSANRSFSVADIRKAMKFLNWRPETTFEEGVAKFYQWYQTMNKKS